jgi:hypothetical protein
MPKGVTHGALTRVPLWACPAHNRVHVQTRLIRTSGRVLGHLRTSGGWRWGVPPQQEVPGPLSDQPPGTSGTVTATFTRLPGPDVNCGGSRWRRSDAGRAAVPSEPGTRSWHQHGRQRLLACWRPKGGYLKHCVTIKPNLPRASALARPWKDEATSGFSPAGRWLGVDQLPVPEAPARALLGPAATKDSL